MSVSFGVFTDFLKLGGKIFPKSMICLSLLLTFAKCNWSSVFVFDFEHVFDYWVLTDLFLISTHTNLGLLFYTTS